jgi:4-amino-4-deoxy-L-arabinose transferase-like glycosyltransferase
MILPSPGARMKVLRMGIVILILGLLAPFYWTSFQTPAVGYYHDDAIYVVTAKALANGQGYRLIHLPEQPEQTKYPIVFPAVMALIWVIVPEFPQNLPFLKLVPLIAAMIWLWATYRLLSARQRDAAVPIVLLVAASPVSVFLATSLLAESLLAMFATLSLLWLDRAAEGPSSMRNALVAGLFASLAFNTKTIGVLVVIAGAATLLLRRRYKPFAAFAMISVALCLPWLLWQMAHAQAGAVDSYNSLNNYYKDWSIVGRPWQEQTAVIGKNILLIALSPIQFTGSSRHVVALGLTLILNVFGVAGFISDGRRLGYRALHIYSVLYLLVIVVWPWPPLRFIWPILPILLYFAYCGLVQAWKHAPLVAMIAAVTCLGLALPAQSHSVELASAPTLPFGPDQLRWPDFLQAMRQVASTTDSEDRILGILDPTIFLYTGRKGIRGFDADPIKLFYSDDVRHALGDQRDFERMISSRGIDWILDIPPGHFAEGPVLSGLVEGYLATRHYSPEDILTVAPGFRLMKTRPAVLPER